MFTLMSETTNYFFSLTKNLIYLNSVDFLIFTGILFNLWYALSIYVFRKKFIFFLFFLFFLSVWGFYYSWDGWTCLLLLTELLVILLFLLVWLTFKFSDNNNSILQKFKIPFFIFSFFFYTLLLGDDYSNFYYTYYSLYWLKHSVISSDFHVMFKFFFLDYSITVFYLTLILSLISIFFICFYLTLKKTQSVTKKKKKTVHILRKQQMTKQALFKSQLRTFQL